jgi:hypothetical protein
MRGGGFARAALKVVAQVAFEIGEKVVEFIFEAGFKQLPHQLSGADPARFRGGLQFASQRFG